MQAVGSPLDPYIDIADEIVPDFRTMKNSGEASFDISAYNSPETTKRLHDTVRALSRFFHTGKAHPASLFFGQTGTERPSSSAFHTERRLH